MAGLVPPPSTLLHREDELQVERLFEKQLAAMAAGDTAALGGLLDDAFTLTHITGYVQPKTEWLGQMRSGQFRYHNITRASLVVSQMQDSIEVVGRISTEATIYGTRNIWRLELENIYEKAGGTWRLMRSVATTW